MDLTLIIYTALGASLGTLLGRLINKLHKGETKKPRVYNPLFIVAGLTILPLLYRNMYLPRIIPLNATDFGSDAVFYESLRKHDPEAYKKIYKPLDRLSRKGGSSPKALQESRLVLEEILAEKRKNANLKELREETALAIWQFKILKDKAPEVCVQRAHGRPFRDLSSVLPKDYLIREAKMLVALVENPMRPEGTLVDSENGATLFTNLVETAKAELGSVNLDPPKSDKAAQEKVCTLLVEVHDDILKVSDQDIYDIYAYINN